MSDLLLRRNSRFTFFRRFVVAALLPSALLLTSAGPVTASVKPKALANVVFGTSTASVNSLPEWVGQSEGFFAAAGLNVSVVALGNGSVVTAALASGSVNYGVLVAPSLMAAVTQGTPIIAISLYSEGANDGLVASNAWAAARHLTYKSPIKSIAQALCGATLAGNGAAIFGAEDIFLRSQGVNPSCVHQVNLTSTAAQQAALANGSIDAFVTSQPTPWQEQETGIGTILADKTTVQVWNRDFANLVVTANKNFAAANPGLTKLLVAAINKSTKFISQHNQKCVAILHQNLPGVPLPALLKAIATGGFVTNGLQSTAIWRKTAAYGVKTGQIPANSTAPEGVDWTNAYVKGGKA